MSDDELNLIRYRLDKIERRQRIATGLLSWAVALGAAWIFDIMLQNWGVGETAAYGLGVTLFFLLGAYLTWGVFGD